MTTQPTEGLPDFAPIMLRGLTWEQVQSNLGAVDCAARRPHWCSPTVILLDGKFVLDDDGDILPLKLNAEERRANDWEMVPRVNDDGDLIPPTYRASQEQPQ